MNHLFRAVAIGLAFTSIAGCAVFSRSSASRLSVTVPETSKRKLETLDARVVERENQCREWSQKHSDLVDAVNRAKNHRVTKKWNARLLGALRTYPGTPPEAMEAALIYVGAPETPGFPQNYAWDWRPIFPRSLSCRATSWFALAKGAASNRGPDGGARVALVLRQIGDESSRNLQLTRQLLHLSTVRALVDAKRVRMPKRVREDFEALELASKDLRSRMRAQDPLLDPKLFGRCRRLDPNKTASGPDDFDCPTEVLAENLDRIGRYFQIEFRETAVLSERLAKLVAQISVR